MMQTPNLKSNGGIDIKQTTELICDNEDCKGKYFNESYMIRKASKLLTGAAQDTIIPIPVMRCADCGNVNDIFKPNEI